MLNRCLNSAVVAMYACRGYEGLPCTATACRRRESMWLARCGICSEEAHFCPPLSLASLVCVLKPPPAHGEVVELLPTTLPAPFGPLLWQITKEQLSEQRHKDVYGTYKRILALPPEQPSGAGTSEPAIDTGGASTSRVCKRVPDRQGYWGLFWPRAKHTED